MEAAVITIKCSSRNGMFGARIQKMEDGDWWRTWAFPLTASTARAERYDRVQVKGMLYPTPEYPGCPYCGAEAVVRCNGCGKLTCWKGETSLKCQWCGIQMENITVSRDGIAVRGGGM